eukprot:752190-Hanusia_phi.AAC.7
MEAAQVDLLLGGVDKGSDRNAQPIAGGLAPQGRCRRRGESKGCLDWWRCRGYDMTLFSCRGEGDCSRDVRVDGIT